MLIEQVLVFLFLVCFLYFIGILNINIFYKLIIFALIFLESIVLLSTFSKFDITLSLGLILSSLVIYFFNINPKGFSILLFDKYRIKTDTLPFTHRQNNILFFGGVIILLSVIFLEYTVFDGTYGSNTLLGLLFGFLCLTYRFVPPRFNFEMNFSLVFMSLILLFIVFPNIYMDINPGSIFSNLFFIGSRETIHILLARPLASFLSLLGYNVYAQNDYVSYEDLESQTLQTVLIGQGCSGIYSFFIVLSAIISYIIISNKNIGNKSYLVIISVVAVSYFANLFRMSVIVIVGHYWGYDMLVWVHATFGSVLFIFWFLVYWYFFEKYIISHVQ